MTDSEREDTMRQILYRLLTDESLTLDQQRTLWIEYGALHKSRPKEFVRGMERKKFGRRLS